MYWPIGRPDASYCPSFRNEQLRFATRQVEHIVEHLDLVGAETVSIIEEKIGDLPQGVDPFGR